MRIAPDTGVVTLANGIEIGPDLTQDAFRASPAAQGARIQGHGTPPWIHLHLSGGKTDGKELLVSLCFHDQTLVDVSITADLYPPGPKDWSGYSVDVEAATKQFHDLLLHEMFGKPSEGGGVSIEQKPQGRETLTQPLRWTFAWGNVFSYHDSKGGGTFITVTYGNRKEEASRGYRG